jgi:hypothetical protein
VGVDRGPSREGVETRRVSFDAFGGSEEKCPLVDRRVSGPRLGVSLGQGADGVGKGGVLVVDSLRHLDPGSRVVRYAQCDPSSV